MMGLKWLWCSYGELRQIRPETLRSNGKFGKLRRIVGGVVLKKPTVKNIMPSSITANSHRHSTL